MKPDPHPQVSWLGPRDRRDEPSGLWIGFNTLVGGPPGSGKLSYLRAMIAAFDPTAACAVYDLESDPDTQQATARQLLDNVDQSPPGASPVRRVVHVIRHLHRLPTEPLEHFVAQLEKRLMAPGPPQAGGAPVVRVHATYHEDVQWPSGALARLAHVFPCRIRLSQGCAVQRDLSGFVRHVVANLNRRYGGAVDEIESRVIEELRARASTASLYELRNLIERAYFQGVGKRLTADALRV